MPNCWNTIRGDLPIHEQLIETFHGRNRWLNALAFVFTFAAFGSGLRRGVSVLSSRDDAGDDRLGGRLHVGCCSRRRCSKCGSGSSCTGISLTREIKRLELQIANLSRQLAVGK